MESEAVRKSADEDAASRITAQRNQKSSYMMKDFETGFGKEKTDGQDKNLWAENDGGHPYGEPSETGLCRICICGEQAADHAGAGGGDEKGIAAGDPERGGLCQ